MDTDECLRLNHGIGFSSKARQTVAPAQLPAPPQASPSSPFLSELRRGGSPPWASWEGPARRDPQSLLPPRRVQPRQTPAGVPPSGRPAYWQTGGGRGEDWPLREPIAVRLQPGLAYQRTHPDWPREVGGRVSIGWTIVTGVVVSLSQLEEQSGVRPASGKTELGGD